jgi:hypothetical protein
VLLYTAVMQFDAALAVAGGAAGRYEDELAAIVASWPALPNVRRSSPASAKMNFCGGGSASGAERGSRGTGCGSRGDCGCEQLSIESAQGYGRLAIRQVAAWQAASEALAWQEAKRTKAKVPPAGVSLPARPTKRPFSGVEDMGEAAAKPRREEPRAGSASAAGAGADDVQAPLQAWCSRGRSSTVGEREHLAAPVPPQGTPNIPAHAGFNERRPPLYGAGSSAAPSVVIVSSMEKFKRLCMARGYGIPERCAQGTGAQSHTPSVYGIPRSGPAAKKARTRAPAPMPPAADVMDLCDSD